MIRIGLVALALLLVPTWHDVASAAESPSALAARYGAEQAEVRALRSSTTAKDKRALGDLLSDGLLAAADNPLRAPDRMGAVAAYRAAMEAGDRSSDTLVALVRLVLDDNDADPAQRAALAARLRAAAFDRNSEAAYLLAVASREGWLVTQESPQALMESAAVMGSMSAVLELARSDAGRAETLKTIALDTLQLKASTGNAGAMVTLAHLNRDGIVIKLDQAEASRWLEAAVTAGHVPAMLELASRLVHQIGAPADPVRAHSLLVEAAEKGSVAAAVSLGLDAVTAGPMKVEPVEARHWLAYATAVGAPRAAMGLATLDLRAALRPDVGSAERGRMIEAALAPVAGDAEALANLASQFQKRADGRYIADHLLPLLHDSTLTGNLTAGVAYDAWLRVEGLPLPEDAASAFVDALRASADDGLAPSMFTLATLSLDQRVSEADVNPEEAIELLFAAADADVGQAMLRIARMYASGQTFARSFEFAERWFESAEKLNVEAASWSLADMRVRSADPDRRRQGLQFYRARMADGDTRAATTYVDYLMRTGTMDRTILAKAEAQAQGSSEDLVNLARVLAGSVGAADLEDARRILTPLVGENPDAEALVLYARTLLGLENPPADLERGLEMLKRATAMGSSDAKVALAGVYLSNFSYKAQQADAVAMIRDVIAREPMNTSARLLLSDAYLMGNGVRRDPATAAQLVTEVLAEGPSQRPDAVLLEADWLSFSDVRRDPQRAVSILGQQAALGSVAARRSLGIAYLNGFGPRHDADLAAGYLFRAAKDGDKEAMAALGHLLLNGMGVNRSSEEGLAWLTRAAEAGNTTAMYDLSRIFALGTTGRIDPVESIAWLKRAAQRNHPAAAYQLGLAYLEGDGVAENREEAIRWFERSKSVGNLLADRTLQQLSLADASHPTPSDDQ